MTTITTQAKRRRAVSPAGHLAGGRPTSATHCVGIVTEIGPQGPIVSSGGLIARAHQAVSCLLAVAVGDTVACLQVAPDELWILAILQREEGVTQVLRCQGDTRFEVQDGALCIEAPTVGLRGDQMSIRAESAEVTTDTLRMVGREATIVGATLKAVGTALSTAFERVTHFSRQHSRRTEGLDRVSATHIEQSADQLLKLSGEHALINGDKLVKTRGSQIHFG